MPVTMEEVRFRLEAIEPNYGEAAAALGEEALPLLQELVEQEDPLLAPGALFLASLIAESQAIPLVEAARSSRVQLRIAAAHALIITSCEEVPTSLVDRLLSDKDVGVRKTVLRSIESSPEYSVTKEAQDKVLGVAENDPDPFLRQVAFTIFTQLDLQAGVRPKPVPIEPIE